MSAVPRHGLGQPPVACWVGRSLGLLTAAPPIPLGRVQVASKATTAHRAWERTSSAGQGAGRRYTALTDRLQQG